MSEWNREAAEWYAEKYGEYATNRVAVDALELAPDSTIVDVGCGTGAALRHASSRVTAGTLIGIDPVPRMVEIARERAATHPNGDRIEFREGPASKLPVEDGTADFVLAFDSFDYWADIEQGLAEVRRVLKPGGRFVVVKDGGVPDGAKLRTALAESLEPAGFDVVTEQQLAEEDVSMTMWVCAVSNG